MPSMWEGSATGWRRASGNPFVVFACLAQSIRRGALLLLVGRLGRRYFVTVARPDHKDLAAGAKRLKQSNLQQLLRLPPRAV
jgi:hypothetical protein